MVLDRNNSFINKAVQFLHHECQDIPYIFCIENEKNTIVRKLSKYLPSGLLYAPFTSAHSGSIIEIIMDCAHKKKYKNGNVVPGNEVLLPEQKHDKHAFFRSRTEIMRISYDARLFVFPSEQSWKVLPPCNDLKTFLNRLIIHFLPTFNIRTASERK